MGFLDKLFKKTPEQIEFNRKVKEHQKNIAVEWKRSETSSVQVTRQAGTRQLHSYVAGTRFNNEDGTSRQRIINRLSPGDELRMIPYLYQGETAIYMVSDFGTVGNLPKDLAEEFTYKLQRGQVHSVVIDRITEKEGINYLDIVININN